MVVVGVIVVVIGLLLGRLKEDRLIGIVIWLAVFGTGLCGFGAIIWLGFSCGTALVRNRDGSARSAFGTQAALVLGVGVLAWLSEQ